MGKKIAFLLSLFLALFVSYSSADWQKQPELRLQQLFRYDIRGNDHNLYTDRISATFAYLDAQEKTLLQLEPFYEARRNMDYKIWERQELGVEIGAQIFPFLYVGESIQGVRLKEDYRNCTRYQKRCSTESETRLMFSHNLLSTKNITLKGFILNEYTYDLKAGAGVRNEVAIGMTAPVFKHLEAGLNWRHVDRIHDFDSDNIEASAALVF